MKTTLILLLILSQQILANPYQIGASWDREGFTKDNRDSLPLFLQNKALAIGTFLGGTAFYLGKVEGRHLMATNYHVLPNALNCYSLNLVNFKILGESFRCKKFIQSFSEIEISFFEIAVPKDKESALKGLAISLNTKTNSLATELFVLGYGGHLNPGRNLLLMSSGKLCRDFQAKLEFISDPDKINPVDYKVWSKVNGCDVSHGDSGSPLFNRKGQFVGIAWTGGSPKHDLIKNEHYVESLIGADSLEVWTELSYYIPQYKIIDFIQMNFNDTPTDKDLSLLMKLLSK